MEGDGLGVRYFAYDFSAQAKRDRRQVLPDLIQLSKPMADATGIFLLGPNGSRSLQRGVVRSNCIDSLDRTNVAQVSGPGRRLLQFRNCTWG